MSYSTKRAMIGIVPEATAGTFVNPATADAAATPQVFPADNIKWDPDAGLVAISESRQHFGALPGVPGIGKSKLSFDVYLRGRTGAGTAPHFRNALMACGMSEKVAASTSVTYFLSSLDDGSSDAAIGVRPKPTYSLALWEDGKKYTLSGAKGNLKIEAKAGQPIKLSFEFSGTYLDPSEEAVPTPAAVSAFVPPTFLGVGLTANFGASFANMEFETLSAELGNTLAEAIDANSVSGLKYYAITARKPTASIDPNLTAEAAHDFYAILRAGTVGSIQTGVIGSTAGNRVQIIMPTVQYSKLAPGDRSSLRTVDASLDLVSPSTATEGQELQILFT